MNEPNQDKNLNPLTGEPRKQTGKERYNEELTAILAARKKRRNFALFGIIAIVLIAVGVFYFAFYKPYTDGMNLIKRSEEQLKASDYTGARKTLARAKLVAPFLKSVYYRDGMILLMQMDYTQAEEQFKKEISSNGYVAGSELALGFLYTIDSTLANDKLSIDAKRKVVEELSRVLQIDIALDSKTQKLGLSETDSYLAAYDHFGRAIKSDAQFLQSASFGLAYVSALKGDKDDGNHHYGLIASNRERFPILARYYETTDSSLGMEIPQIASVPEENPAESVEEPPMPELPIGELPSTAEEEYIPDLPDIGMISPDKPSKLQNLKSFKRKPTVKPFKLKQYPSKDGELKYIVTLQNISESGQTVAREGQKREMPNTRVEVLVVKLSEDEIILREDDIYTFKWKRDRMTWVEVET